MQNYNILFMGTSKFAVPILEGLLESSVNIQAVFSAPPKLANRGMKKTMSPVARCAEEYQLPLECPLSLKDPETINKIKELNPDIIATGCPFCNTMMTDGIKLANKEGSVHVMDIAELIAQAQDL